MHNFQSGCRRDGKQDMQKEASVGGPLFLWEKYQGAGCFQMQMAVISQKIHYKTDICEIECQDG